MRLRNKKTGKRGLIAECNNYFIVVYPVNDKWEAYSDEKYVYHSLSEVCEDWEDYTPAEPLIKDEKIRKAVRAWAEANGYDKLWVYHDHDAISFYNEDDGDNEIIFNTVEKFGLEHLKCYTITELCGEE